MNRHAIPPIVLLLALLVATVPLRAQEPTTGTEPLPASTRTPWYVGVSAGIFHSLHSGTFSWPEACSDCARYDQGSGIGTALDLRISIPLARWLRLEPRLFGECHRARFTSDPITVNIIGRDLQPEAARLEDELAYTLRLIGIEAMAAVSLGPHGFSLLAGPALGFRITESATVTERLVSPDGAVFLDGSREHPVAEGDVEKARSLHAGMRAGASYTLPLGSDLRLGLEATWLLPFQTVTDEEEWRTSGVRVLASLLFTM